ncbi:MAG: efflux transporter outer membrane subunit [Thermodesulfobacteriota bacterium]
MFIGKTKNSSLIIFRLIPAMVMVCLSGCVTVGPDYKVPQTSVGNTWRNALKSDQATNNAEPQSLTVWWTLFDDPLLNNLMDRAVKGNLDLKKAQARVREARARRGAAEGGLYPSLDASGTGSRSRSSEETGTGKTMELYRVGFDALWEVDIFGGLRRNVEAAEATLQAYRESQRDVLVTLLAEVAVNYLDLRTYQSRLSNTEKNLQSQKVTYQLTLWRHQAGLLDELAVQQARYTLENIRAQIPVLKTRLEESLNRLAVLVGEKPGELHQEMDKWKTVKIPPIELAIGVPADLLRRRPDIRKAERELAAQTARIGIAESDLYPKLKLNGSIGLEALGLSNLFSLGSRTLSGGLGITWPIFHAGIIRQNIEIQSALQEQALLAYEAAILKAQEETENALKAYAEEHVRYTTLLETVSAAERVLNLTRDKFEAGLVDFNQVLEAQSALWSFQDQIAVSRGNLCSFLVRLYKTLGGGWESWALEGEKEKRNIFTIGKNLS